MRESDPNILLVDKPKGISSFDVIRRLRTKLGVKKIGHAGTLDPLASGLMIVGVGEATKKLSAYLKLPKTYQVEVLLGVRTTTGDLEGEVLEEKEVAVLDRARVEREMRGLVGINELPVPVYSAVKQKGRPLYNRARAGEKVKPPRKKMRVRGSFLYDISYKNVSYNDKSVEKSVVVYFALEVESGVYVRSVAEELGRRLGYPATVGELRRTRIGEFEVKDAQKL